MKPRAIQSLADFDAAPAPPEGGAFLSYPLPHIVPPNHKLSGHIYIAHPLDTPALLCIPDRQSPDLVPVELRKYHSKVEVEYRRVVPVTPRKEAT